MTDDTNATSSPSVEIPVTLKWSKKTFSLTLELGESSTDFKQRVQSLTGVPLARQKLLAKKGGWKGTLKDNVILDASIIVMKKSSAALVVTLIGSAETLVPPKEKTKFVEDLSPDDLRAAEEAQEQAALESAEGMIRALQLPPHLRDDGKMEMYQYNRLVSGLPQQQIEQGLKQKRRRIEEHGESRPDGTSEASSLDLLEGRVAMQFGLELRRAYVNDLTVLRDGTCVSVLDDGHVQMWKHAKQQCDVIHPDSLFVGGGVDSVVALNPGRDNHGALAFATAGRGSVQLWTNDGDSIAKLPCGIPGISPTSLQCVFGGSRNNGSLAPATPDDDDNTFTCMANRLKVIRQPNPNQFRLPPQTDAERQRRAQAEQQERSLQQSLAHAARSIQVWYSARPSLPLAFSPPVVMLQLTLQPPTQDLGGSAPITCLATLFPRVSQNENSEGTGNFRFLIAGDTAGGLRLWKAQRNENNSSVQFHHHGLYQLVASDEDNGDTLCSVVCMEALQDGRLVVSTNSASIFPGGGSGDQLRVLAGATQIKTPAARAVHILDLSELFSNNNNETAMPTIQSTLLGHTKDAVICMCSLPDGGILTGGGKLDATLQLWSQSQLEGRRAGVGHSHGGDYCSSNEEAADDGIILQRKASKTLTDVGYVFALAVLPDAKSDSQHYAVAAARYNTVKIII